jgi:hypothetical protein
VSWFWILGIYHNLDLSEFANFRIGILTVKLHGAEERQHEYVQWRIILFCLYNVSCLV